MLIEDSLTVSPTHDNSGFSKSQRQISVLGKLLIRSSTSSIPQAVSSTIVAVPTQLGAREFARRFLSCFVRPQSKNQLLVVQLVLQQRCRIGHPCVLPLSLAAVRHEFEARLMQEHETCEKGFFKKVTGIIAEPNIRSAAIMTTLPRFNRCAAFITPGTELSRS
jgi:hypothetical protein